MGIFGDLSNCQSVANQKCILKKHQLSAFFSNPNFNAPVGLLSAQHYPMLTTGTINRSLCFIPSSGLCQPTVSSVSGTDMTVSPTANNLLLAVADQQRGHWGPGPRPPSFSGPQILNKQFFRT